MGAIACVIACVSPFILPHSNSLLVYIFFILTIGGGVATLVLPLMALQHIFQCETYILTTRRIILQSGLVAKSSEELPMNEAISVSVFRGFGKSIVGVATLVITFKSGQVFRICNVTESDTFLKAIRTQIK
jgi:hypothetical protein